MHRLVMLAMVGVFVALMSGSAAASHSGLLFGAPVRINVVMTEYAFSPARITLEAGTAVDLVIENKGILSHTFMVYTKPPNPPKGVGDWYEYVLKNTYFQNMGEILVHTRGEFVVSGTRIGEVAVEQGKKVTLTFTPTRKGTFEIGCQLSTGAGATHASAGMKGVLIVK